MDRRKYQASAATLVLAVLFVTYGASAAEPSGREKTMTEKEKTSDTQAEVRKASDQFYAALNRMFKGEMAPMVEIWSHSDDVTNMGPFGPRQEGWKQVRAQFEREAALKLGGRVASKDVLVRGNGDMGYTVCIEQGENVDSSGKPIRVNHRATNVFRREAGKWKLVHHHTDLSEDLQKASGHMKK